MLNSQVPDRRPTGEENCGFVATRPRYHFCLARYLADSLRSSLADRRLLRGPKRRRCPAAGPRPITSPPRGDGLASVPQGVTSALSSSGFCAPRLWLPARLGLRSDSFLVFLFFSYSGKLCRRSGQSHPRLAVLGGNRWEPVEQGG
jgi:hypothetical protein